MAERDRARAELARFYALSLAYLVAALGSAVGMDKIAMKDLFRAHNLPIVEYATVRRHDWEREPGPIARDIGRNVLGAFAIGLGVATGGPRRRVAPASACPCRRCGSTRSRWASPPRRRR